MLKKRPKIEITPKGLFTLRMIEEGYAKVRSDRSYDITAICNAWEDGKKAFARAVCRNEEMRKLLPTTITSAGCATTTDTTDILRALEDAFGESFTNS